MSMKDDTHSPLTYSIRNVEPRCLLRVRTVPETSKQRWARRAQQFGRMAGIAIIATIAALILAPSPAWAPLIGFGIAFILITADH